MTRSDYEEGVTLSGEVGASPRTPIPRIAGSANPPGATCVDKTQVFTSEQLDCPTTEEPEKELAIPRRKTPREGLADRKWPLVATVALVATGMAYTLFWWPLRHGVQAWGTPGDIWATFRDAHFIGWGGAGDLYGAQTGLVSFPGIAVLLAPVAMLSGHFHLTEAFPIGITHPSAWVLLGPAELLCGASVLFPLDKLAERLGLSSKRRIVLVFVEAALVWPTVAIWGHPEDPIAIALALYGLLAAYDKKWKSAGWWFGAAIAFQPLVILILPLTLALLPARRWIRVIVQGALPSVVLLLPSLLQDWNATTHALLKQPNYPSVDHPTPWLSFAPVLTHASKGIAKTPRLLDTGGVKHFTILTSTVHNGQVVAAGPGRLIAIGIATIIAVLVWRRRPSLRTVVCLAGVSFALRCIFESVMDPYYVWPALALGVLAAAAYAWKGLLVAVLAAGAETYITYRFVGPWMYYVPMVALLAVVAAASTWSGTPRLGAWLGRFSGVHTREVLNGHRLEQAPIGTGSPE